MAVEGCGGGGGVPKLAVVPAKDNDPQGPVVSNAAEALTDLTAPPASRFNISVKGAASVLLYRHHIPKPLSIPMLNPIIAKLADVMLGRVPVKA